jgi:nicotinamide riboside kinase
MNENVIGLYVHKDDRRDIITYLRENVVSYNDGRRFLESKEKRDYFVDVVNDCLKNIYWGKDGYVFSESQLKEVMMIKPDVKVRWSCRNECYYCW